MPTKKPLDLITEEDRERERARIAKRNAKRAKNISPNFAKMFNGAEKAEKDEPKSES